MSDDSSATLQIQHDKYLWSEVFLCKPILNFQMYYLLCIVSSFSTCLLLQIHLSSSSRAKTQTAGIIIELAVPCDYFDSPPLSVTRKFLSTDAAGWSHIYSKCVTVSRLTVIYTQTHTHTHAHMHTHIHLSAALHKLIHVCEKELHLCACVCVTALLEGGGGGGGRGFHLSATVSGHHSAWRCGRTRGSLVDAEGAREGGE